MELKLYVFFFFLLLLFLIGYIYPEITHENKSKMIQDIVKPESYSKIQIELMNYAFTDPIIKTEKIYKPITSIMDIYTHNSRILVLYDEFENIYQALRIKSVKQLYLDEGKTRVVRVEYNYKTNSYYSYAYGKIPDKCSKRKSAALIIPGSGHNQSYKIANNDETNYHYGIFEALSFVNDIYIYIKPNQSVLAWHNGVNKLDDDFYVNYHLNQGGSYSASYIVNSLALSKYISSCYDKTVLAGLSQGGTAALLNSIQSKPDVAIISSGYSVINSRVEWAGHNQIIIPKVMGDLYNYKVLFDSIKNTNTQFLFTWGRKEKGTYGFESVKQESCIKFKSISNLTCVVHKEGHIFPAEVIKDFIKTKFGH